MLRSEAFVEYFWSECYQFVISQTLSFFKWLQNDSFQQMVSRHTAKIFLFKCKARFNDLVHDSLPVNVYFGTRTVLKIAEFKSVLHIIWNQKFKHKLNLFRFIKDLIDPRPFNDNMCDKSKTCLNLIWISEQIRSIIHENLIAINQIGLPPR